MTVEVAVFLTRPPEPERLVWCEWLRRHSVDPNDVLASGWIERDEVNRRIRYASWQRDADGQVVVEDDEIVRETHVVQLEAAPLPFPTFPKGPAA